MGETVLVTATDTGVGKTVVSAWLALAVQQSLKVALVKAIQSGRGERWETDEAFYQRSVGTLPNVTTATIVSLREPLAPSIAARREGRDISFDEVVDACQKISRQHDLTIIEGSGGILVPINEESDYSTLARALDALLVVVIRPGLGTINHTLLTIKAAETNGLTVTLLVCTGVTDPTPVVVRENVSFLRDRLPSIPLLLLSWSEGVKEASLSSVRAQLLGSRPFLLSNSDLNLHSLNIDIDT